MAMNPQMGGRDGPDPLASAVEQAIQVRANGAPWTGCHDQLIAG